jgi:hypothetical protein
MYLVDALAMPAMSTCAVYLENVSLTAELLC